MIFLGTIISVANTSKSLVEKQKLESAIELTKSKIRKPQDLSFLPDLYMMLADLQIQYAHLKMEIRKESSPQLKGNEIDFTGEKKLILDALENYRIVEEKFPNYPSIDKAMYFLATEYKGVGDVESALKVYHRLFQKFPESKYADEAIVGAGTIYFEKKDFDHAIFLFQKVLQSKSSVLKGVAAYKIGWCYINKEKWLDAALNFHRVFDEQNPMIMETGTIDRKNDVREEALVASVWPMLELQPEETQKNPVFLNPLIYYKERSYDMNSYRRVLNRLGKRLILKNRIKEAQIAFYESFRLADDLQTRIDAMESFYDTAKKLQLQSFPENAHHEVAKTLIWIDEDGEYLPRKISVSSYEPLLRDLVTMIHKKAKESGRSDDFLQAAEAYREYVFVYPSSKFTSLMYLNMAEAYFQGKNFSDAGVIYEKLAGSQKNSKLRQDFYGSAIRSYVEALKDQSYGTNLERVQSRTGVRSIAMIFEKEFSNSKSLPMIRFNLAKTYYDERDFQTSIKLLMDFLKRHPSDSLAEQASLMYLDTYYQQDKMSELVRQANILLSLPLDPRLKSTIQQVAGQAQFKNARSIAGDFGSTGYASRFLELAQKAGNSSLAEPALYEAFLSAKSKNDSQALDIGSTYLRQFSMNPKASLVLLSMIQLASNLADYRKMVLFMEAFADKFKNDPQSVGFQQDALRMSEYLGDIEHAIRLAEKQNLQLKVGRLLTQSQDWNRLHTYATNIPGVEGLYYQGLAAYRLGKPNALTLLERLETVDVNPDVPDEMMAKAHALFIIAESQYRTFLSVDKKETEFSKSLNLKNVSFQKLNQSLQKVISIGVGQWSIASLYLLGRAQKDFSAFLKQAKAPAGLSQQKLKEMLKPQIDSFQSSSTASFSQCIKEAEKSEVLTEYVQGCLSAAAISISEKSQSKAMWKSPGVQVNFKEESAALAENPKDIPTLWKVAVKFSKSGEYGMGLVTMQKILDIKSDDLNVQAFMAVLFQAQGLEELALEKFQEILSKNPEHPASVHSVYEIYKRIGFKEKAKQFESLHLKLGPAPFPLFFELQKVGRRGI